MTAAMTNMNALHMMASLRPAQSTMKPGMQRFGRSLVYSQSPGQSLYNSLNGVCMYVCIIMERLLVLIETSPNWYGR